MTFGISDGCPSAGMNSSAIDCMATARDGWSLCRPELLISPVRWYAWILIREAMMSVSLCHQDEQIQLKENFYLLKSHKQTCSNTLHIQDNNSTVVLTKKVSTICNTFHFINDVCEADI